MKICNFIEYENNVCVYTFYLRSIFVVCHIFDCIIFRHTKQKNKNEERKKIENRIGERNLGHPEHKIKIKINWLISFNQNHHFIRKVEYFQQKYWHYYRQNLFIYLFGYCVLVKLTINGRRKLGSSKNVFQMRASSNY